MCACCWNTIQGPCRPTHTASDSRLDYHLLLIILPPGAAIHPAFTCICPATDTAATGATPIAAFSAAAIAAIARATAAIGDTVVEVPTSAAAIAAACAAAASAATPPPPPGGV